METAVSTPTTSATPAPAAVSTPTSGTTTTATSTPTPAERPKTFAEAFANDAASQTSETSTAPDGATTLPVEAAETTGATPLSTKAEPPTEKWPQILDNARAKERSAVMAEVQTQLSQVVGIPPAELSQLVEFSRTVHTDPQGHTFGMLKGLLADPVHGPKTRSELARMFGGLRAPAPVAAPDFTPDVQITDESGRVVGSTFSAERVKALLEHQVQERIAPLQQESEQRKAERDHQAAQAKAAETTKQVNAKADEILSEVTDILDGDHALMSEVSRLMDANPNWTAHKAALEVRKTKIAPALAGKAQADVLASLKTKAAAQAVNPAGAVVATTSRPRSFLDKSLKW